MDFLKDVLSGLTVEILSAIGTVAIAAIIGYFGWSKKTDADQSNVNASVKVRNGDYIAIDGNGNQVQKIQKIQTTNITNKYGAQRTQEAGDGSDIALALFAGVAAVGGLVTAVRYFHYFASAPLWIALITAVISIAAWVLQQSRYSSAARNKMLLSNLTLFTSSLFLSKTINAIQEPDSAHSLGRVADEIEKIIPADSGWLTKFISRAGEFFKADSGEYRLVFILALVGITLSVTIFIMAFQRVLGSLLIPATSAGYVYKWKALNVLNNVFVNSKIWGYCLMITSVIFLWWSVTDPGAEFWLEQIRKVGEAIKHAAETAV